MRLSAALLACVAVLSASTALAQSTLPLHAVVTGFGPCAPTPADPCDPGPPTTQVNQGDGLAIYLLTRNYDELAGVQTAFEWGDWTWGFGLWDCQANQLNAVTPGPPGGETAGSITTAFDCLTGGATTVIGRMHLTAGTGCIVQVPSSFPFANHTINCSAEPTAVPELGQGTVCVGSAGVDACAPVVPVETTTWGSIKAQYK